MKPEWCFLLRLGSSKDRVLVSSRPSWPGQGWRPRPKDELRVESPKVGKVVTASGLGLKIAREDAERSINGVLVVRSTHTTLEERSEQR